MLTSHMEDRPQAALASEVRRLPDLASPPSVRCGLSCHPKCGHRTHRPLQGMGHGRDTGQARDSSGRGGQTPTGLADLLRCTVVRQAPTSCSSFPLCTWGQGQLSQPPPVSTPFPPQAWSYGVSPEALSHLGAACPRR